MGLFSGIKKAFEKVTDTVKDVVGGGLQALSGGLFKGGLGAVLGKVLPLMLSTLFPPAAAFLATPAGTAVAGLLGGAGSSLLAGGEKEIDTSRSLPWA